MSVQEKERRGGRGGGLPYRSRKPRPSRSRQTTSRWRPPPVVAQTSPWSGRCVAARLVVYLEYNGAAHGVCVRQQLIWLSASAFSWGCGGIGQCISASAAVRKQRNREICGFPILVGEASPGCPVRRVRGAACLAVVPVPNLEQRAQLPYRGEHVRGQRREGEARHEGNRCLNNVPLHTSRACRREHGRCIAAVLQTPPPRSPARSEGGPPEPLAPVTWIRTGTEPGSQVLSFWRRGAGQCCWWRW